MKTEPGRRPVVVEGSCSSGAVVAVRGSGDHAATGGQPGDTLTVLSRPPAAGDVQARWP